MQADDVEEGEYVCETHTGQGKKEKLPDRCMHSSVARVDRGRDAKIVDSLPLAR